MFQLEVLIKCIILKKELIQFLKIKIHLYKFSIKSKSHSVTLPLFFITFVKIDN
jgi:hypothetical protein